MKCRKRWVKLDSQAALVCKDSYEFFDDAVDIEVANADGIYFFHHTCYKRIGDENKILIAEEKFSKVANIEYFINIYYFKCTLIVFRIFM